jgi:hypothetical protein
MLNDLEKVTASYLKISNDYKAGFAGVGWPGSFRFGYLNGLFDGGHYNMIIHEIQICEKLIYHLCDLYHAILVSLNKTDLEKILIRAIRYVSYPICKQCIEFLYMPPELIIALLTRMRFLVKTQGKHAYDSLHY